MKSVASTADSPAAMEKSERYLDRELSWLEFNQRVLDQAMDEEVPLLERLKFLAITGSNLDEFFRVRVGGLQMVRDPNRQVDVTGKNAQEQLLDIRARVKQLVTDQYACYDTLESALAAEGFCRTRSEEISDRQLPVVERYVAENCVPVFTPQRISDVQVTPLLPGQSLFLGARLAPAAAGEDDRFAVIPISSGNRFVTLPSEGTFAFMLLEDVIASHSDAFFPGEDVLECVAFRLTRNADIAIREEMAADLMAEMEDLLDARKESQCVRLEVSSNAGEQLVSHLAALAQVKPEDVFLIPGPLDLSAFMQLSEQGGFESLRYEPWDPQMPPSYDQTATVFENIAQQDILLCHPYDSFLPVVRLVEEAAKDREVLAIKQTLYRTSKNSPVIRALERAAENGKAVTVVLELKARFDEERNIRWARHLEQAGVQVIYGVKGLKTHSKVLIVVRSEPHGIQRYVHYGTGNYNEKTARLYSDISLLTCNEEFGADATSFFNAVSGYSQPQAFRKIEAAPIGLRQRLLEMIRGEITLCKEKGKGHIVAKLNSLVDAKIIDALYEASQAGVKVQLNIRGICCLRPGVPGLSDNIEVISIVDRYLEHARIMYFHHDGDERAFISSADWMPRNLDRRVELLVPVEDPRARKRLIHILQTYFRDNVKARRLLPDGSYVDVEPKGRARYRSQEELYRETVLAVKRAQQSQRATLEPHQPPRERTG